MKKIHELISFRSSFTDPQTLHDLTAREFMSALSVNKGQTADRMRMDGTEEMLIVLSFGKASGFGLGRCDGA